MLILSRTPGTSIVIGNDITVTVLGVSGRQVRIGIAAPRDVRVDREEIREKINAEGAHHAAPDTTRTVAPQYGRPLTP